MKRFGVLAALFTAASGIWLMASGTQQNVQPMSFEAATIKPFYTDPKATMRFTGGSCHGVDKKYTPGSLEPPPLGRCVFKHVSLRILLGIAYKAAAEGGPAWATDDYYDVEGKAEDTANVTEAQLIAMLQDLIKSRFHAEFHREQRQVPAFTMTVAKNGLKIKESAGEKDAAASVMFGPGSKVTAKHVTMTYFANAIRGMAHGPVTDNTGLTGTYDFEFEFQPGEPDAFLSDMQFALGLHLESTKTPMDFLIIDRADKPSPK
jgi:uncharacterized protein (TIGR03435 family)